jgi:hypothetical protein
LEKVVELVKLVSKVVLVALAFIAFDGKQPIMGREWLVMKTLE